MNCLIPPVALHTASPSAPSLATTYSKVCAFSHIAALITTAPDRLALICRSILGLASTSIPLHPSAFSKAHVFENCSPSKAPISRYVPPLFAQKKRSSTSLSSPIWLRCWALKDACHSVPSAVPFVAAIPDGSRAHTGRWNCTDGVRGGTRHSWLSPLHTPVLAPLPRQLKASQSPACASRDSPMQRYAAPLIKQPEPSNMVPCAAAAALTERAAASSSSLQRNMPPRHKPHAAGPSRHFELGMGSLPLSTCAPSTLAQAYEALGRCSDASGRHSFSGKPPLTG
mmetsp:Transcript_22305/g.43383  ORF Transcript_22305/g.43383 Transcript_22305/m.43383 type:complete len:284 (+) Transcript_22305:395-1246(+)